MMSWSSRSNHSDAFVAAPKSIYAKRSLCRLESGLCPRRLKILRHRLESGLCPAPSENIKAAFRERTCPRRLKILRHHLESGLVRRRLKILRHRLESGLVRRRLKILGHRLEKRTLSAAAHTGHKCQIFSDGGGQVRS